MSDDLRLYIVTKNAIHFPKGAHFQPIQGGAAMASSLIPGTIGDHTGDNVSLLNEYYAEISSMYWVWKNAKPSRHVGFFHYRRFLNFGAPLSPDEHWSVRNFFDFEPSTMERFGWTKSRALTAIGDADLVVPHRELVSRPPAWDRECSIYTHYRNSHISRDINLALEVLKEVHPSDHKLAEQVIHSNTGYFCHLYVLKWEIFQDYMAWLMPILQGVYARIDVCSPIYAMSTGQTRMLGFIGERFFNIWIERCRQEGKSIREFERLFGKFPNEWTLPPEAPRTAAQKRITRFQKGLSVNMIGWQVDIFSPD